MKKSSVRKKVLIALSGGVDSSVAAALLVDAGYDVTAAFMVQYYDPSDTEGRCWRTDYRDAVRVAAHLGIPIVRWHFEDEYRKQVFAYMQAEYAIGRTPNPDVLCNKTIKFGSWLRRAKKEGFDILATGHYAKTRNKDGVLYTAKDTAKDQTYFLHQVSAQQLEDVLFPIGHWTKSQVRSYAKKKALPTANKSESMGLCFVGKVPMREFLKKDILSKKGKVIDIVSGKILGFHTGAWYYTIGQRHVGVSSNHALYVVAKDMRNNVIFVGEKNHSLLHPNHVALESVHTIDGCLLDMPLRCAARFRHGGEKISAILHKEKGNIVLELKKPVWAPAPGQFAVLYSKDRCLGGGVVAASNL